MNDVNMVTGSSLQSEMVAIAIFSVALLLCCKVTPRIVGIYWQTMTVVATLLVAFWLTPVVHIAVSMSILTVIVTAICVALEASLATQVDEGYTEAESTT